MAIPKLELVVAVDLATNPTAELGMPMEAWTILVELAELLIPNQYPLTITTPTLV